MRCDPRRRRVRDAGMATAELAACLPVLVLVLGVAISAVVVVSARVRVADAAREAARAAGRGDPAAARALARSAAPGSVLRTSTAGGEVTAVVSRRVHLFGLPGVTVRERAVAALEPGAATTGSTPTSPP